MQADLLEAIASALTGVSVDYRALEPLGPEELADVLAGRDLGYRQRIVHHMVLGELVLRPIPVVVAHRVAKYAEALGVKDDFVRVARRYAQGAYGLAWMDLQRNGFVEHVREADDDERRGRGRAAAPDPFEPAQVDPELAARWTAFAELPAGTLGRWVWEMYDEPRLRHARARPAARPRISRSTTSCTCSPTTARTSRASSRSSAFIGRADPDPKGFAWLATLIGLFETGYISSTGFFDRDVRERNIRAPGMHQRIADAIRRGKVVCERYGVDLFDVDYYELADRPVEEVRELLGVPAEVVRRDRGRIGRRRSISKACPRTSGGSSRNVEEATT